MNPAHADPSSAPEPATDPAPPAHFTAVDIFFGADGLRAPWGILLFHILRIGLLAYCAFPFLTRLFPGMSGATLFSKPASMLTYEGTGLLAVAAATWLLAKIERRPVSAFGLGGRHRVRNFVAGLAWGVALLSLLVFSLRAAGLLVFDGRLLSGRNEFRYGAIWLAGFLFVGMFEEYLFRGYLQFTLTRLIRDIVGWFRAMGSQSSGTRIAPGHTPRLDAISFWIAALLLSCYFSLDHTANSGESPLGLVAVVLIGLVFCLSLWRTGSLWWAIGFHASWDWAQSFLYGVADSGGMVEGRLYATHPVGRPILSGGLTGPEGSFFIVPIVALIAAVVLLTLPRTRALTPVASTEPPSLD